MWRKSSYSAHNGNCVEVHEAVFRKSGHSNPNGACVEMAFRKSSHSGSNGHCVEMADGCGNVHVRDSKDKREDAPVLSFTPAVWNAFLAGLK